MRYWTPLPVFLVFIVLMHTCAAVDISSAKLPAPNQDFYGLYNVSISSGSTNTYTFTLDPSARYMQAGVAVISGAVTVQIYNGTQLLNPSGQKAVAFLKPPTGPSVQYKIIVTGPATGQSNYTVFWNQLITDLCVDTDNDGYYKYDAQSCTQGNDCDDSNPAVHQGSVATFYKDVDGDGYGNASATVQACAAPTGYVSNSQDCNDSDPNAHQLISCNYNGSACGQFQLCVGSCPTHPAETCNGKDDNCDGQVDEGLTGCSTEIKVTTSYYDATTTNFNAVNLSNVQGLVLEKAAYGKIVFNQNVKFTVGVNLDTQTNVSYNFAYVNPAVFPMLNKQATIYLYNMTVKNPVILKDGQPCSDCAIVSYSSGTLVFNVPHFSNYSAAGSCSDGTIYGQCSTTVPGYCDSGNMVDRCSACGCAPTDLCQSDGTCAAKNCTEGAMAACGSDTGACAFGMKKCLNNTWTECSGGIGPVAETCNGIDDDCNGKIDDNANCCSDGNTQKCGNDQGICTQGEKSCTDGLWGPCQGGTKPNPAGEICGNGLDDNCDGQIDEGCTQCQDGDGDGYGSPASSLCAYPQEDCNDSNPAVHPGAVELCNGIDDNCDGVVDEGCTQPLDTQTKLRIISLYKSGNDASQIASELSLPQDTVIIYTNCANGAQDSSEGGVDCGGACPTECSADYTWIMLSAAGAGILGFMLVMYFKLRKHGKELSWGELKNRWA